MAMRRYNFYLDDDLRRGLDELHARDGILASEAIRRAIGEYLTHRKVRVAPTVKGGTTRTRRK